MFAIVYPQLTEINESDFFIFEISNVGFEEQSQQHSHQLKYQRQINANIQAFFNLKERKHYNYGECSNCHKELILNYTCQCKSNWFCSTKCFNHFIPSSKHKCTLETYSKEVLNINERSLKCLVGIKNLGNTCYMNAAIQCLSNIYELSGFLISKLIKSKGDIFKQFSSTLLKLHFGSEKAISIHNLRNSLGKKYPMFLGNTQEDSEEFLMAIINSLHEELNKPRKTPNDHNANLEFTEDYQKQNNGYKELVSFINNNNSIITNLFLGQFRSSVQCFKCKNISHNFDIFFCLSLPIPVKNEIRVEICFIHFDIAKGITKMSITIESDLFILDLRNSVSSMLNVNPMSFIIGSFTYSTIEKIYHNLTPLSDIFITEERQTSNNIVACFQFDPTLFNVSDNKYNKTDKIHDSFNNSTIDTESAYKKLYFTDLNSEPHETFYTQVDPSFIEIYNAKDFCIRNQELNRVIQNISNTIAHTINLDKTLKYQAQKILINTMSSALLVYTDENYGFNKNYMKVFIKFKAYWDNIKKYPFKRKDILFQRVVYANTKWSLIYFQKYLIENFTIDNNAPEIRIVNPNKNKFNCSCFVCNDPNCVNCLLSDVKGIATIDNLIMMYPMNNNKPIDNSYLYYDFPSRKLTVARYDLEFELCYSTRDPGSFSRVLNQLKLLYFNQDSPLTKQNNKSEIDIYDCLKRFSQKEILDGANIWFCSKCNCAQKAIKKIQINYSPNILIIQLKRFKTGGNAKIDNFVQFSIKDFLLKNYNTNEHYELCGIINHTGTLGFGHYIANCRNYYDGKWYKYDDSNVTEIENEKDLITNFAYVLFYKKKTFSFEKIKSYHSNKNGLMQINEAFSQFMINYVAKAEKKRKKL